MNPQPPHLVRSARPEPTAHAPNAALLIDFDNVTMGIRSDLQTELKRLLQSDIIRGKVAVQRAYADWRRYPQYVVPLSESSIDLIWAPAYGSNKKNATDIRLAVDAMELVFTRPEIGTFILLSGDSDFSSMVLKLKEYGKYVIGVGIRESSSDLLIQNCDEYYSYSELAGLTKESDIVHPRRDPWELVVEAVKQMTAHNDVMRSDRLKQVMQEIDPTFDEKDHGYSRFSKFVDAAASRGLLALTKRDNGQYEIALGPDVPGARAQPEGGVVERPAARERGERGRRGPSRGGDRPEPRAEPRTEPPSVEEPAAPRRGGFSRGFGLIKQALQSLGGSDHAVSADEVRDAVAEIKSDEPVAPAQVNKLLRQAHDRELVDLAKEEDGGYSVRLRNGAEPSATTADEPVTPAHTPEPSPPVTTGASPAVSRGRFRRGSRGGPRAAPPEIPKVGVVEVDPNYRPRFEPPPAPKVEVLSAGPSHADAPVGHPERSAGHPERSEGGGRRRGGRGRGGRGHGSGSGERGAAEGRERSDRGDRGERNGEEGRGRGRRGGRGRGGRGRSLDSREAGGMSEPATREPAPPPPPPPAPKPESQDDSESFWSRVKRGLTGGA
ncbi:MAG: hypothetical protein DMD71_13470 [Gemmatimonadetes bacterium]|nr:MAG: hypothetical protein DMD74_09075 [Gemmatimonadota bacterium]PYO64310.1 MAG: hypothetical protein DMD71_13470 [Gemmatimonadota bacterium]PYO86222.1 MAG: hypothetical protein DMD68_00835 [Gemmatimonadota bacterium]